MEVAIKAQRMDEQGDVQHASELPNGQPKGDKLKGVNNQDPPISKAQSKNLHGQS